MIFNFYSPQSAAQTTCINLSHYIYSPVSQFLLRVYAQKSVQVFHQNRKDRKHAHVRKRTCNFSLIFGWRRYTVYSWKHFVVLSTKLESNNTRCAYGNYCLPLGDMRPYLACFLPSALKAILINLLHWNIVLKSKEKRSHTISLTFFGRLPFSLFHNAIILHVYSLSIDHGRMSEC